MKATTIKPIDIKKNWVVVDAEGQTVGRLASEIALALRGKTKPTFQPHLDTGDNVIVVNAEKVRFTGNKWKTKNYYWHSGYIGGIKSASAEEMLGKHPEHIIKAAVKGMLPKNKLGRKIIKNLKICVGSEHGHEAQKPVPMSPRLVTGEVN